MEGITEEKFNKFSDSLLALTIAAKNSNVASVELPNREENQYITITTEQAVSDVEQFTTSLYEILLEKKILKS